MPAHVFQVPLPILCLLFFIRLLNLLEYVLDLFLHPLLILVFPLRLKIAAKQTRAAEILRLYASKGKTVAAKDTVSYQEQLHLSAGDMIPIIQRGILVDGAGYKGVDVLPDAHEITVEDVQATREWEGVKITPRTAVIFRTGYYKHFREGNQAYLDAIAGLGLPVAQCLVEAGVNLVGADNMIVEAIPPFDHRVHRFRLVHNGVTLVKNMFLEMLAAEKAYEFLLIITPLRMYALRDPG